MLKSILGGEDEEGDEDGEGADTSVGGMMTAALGDLIKTGGGSSKKGSHQMNTMMGKMESLMTLGGLFGVRKRAISSSSRKVKNSADISDEKLEGIQEEEDPHHPETIKRHSSMVMVKLRAFTDMSQKVGDIFGVPEDNVAAAVSKLIEEVDVGTGQVSLTRVLAFFKKIGMTIGPTTEKTLHALFGRKRESAMDLLTGTNDNEDHSCLTAFGLKVPTPHVKLESLCLIMLAAIPLMSGHKQMRDILPELTKLEIVGTLAQDLVEHVAKMLSIHCESVQLMQENGETESNMLLLPDAVVDGLDLIFNMVSASLDHIVPREWRESAEFLLDQMRSGVHSLTEYNKGNLGQVKGHLDEYAGELAKTLKDSNASKMDVAHKFAKTKRKMSLTIGHKAANEVMSEVGTMPVIKANNKTEEGAHWGWGKIRGITRMTGAYSPSKIGKRKDKELEEIDDFLASVMAETGGDDDGFDDAEEDWFDSRL